MNMTNRDDSSRGSIRELMKVAESYYFQEKYQQYKVSISSMREKFTDDELCEELGVSCPCAFNGIIESNICIAESLGLEWNSAEVINQWDMNAERFLSIQNKILNSNVKAPTLQMVYLRLNIVRNYLFWKWIQPNAHLQGSGYLEENLSVAIQCQLMVLDFFNRPCLDLQHKNSKLTTIHLMNLTLVNDIFLDIEANYKIGLSLLELYFLIIQMIIESYGDVVVDEDVKLLEKCVGVVNKIMDKKSQMEVTFKKKSLQEHFISYFKFGFYLLNSRMGDTNLETITNALSFSGSLCYLKLRQYDQSLLIFNNLHQNKESSTVIICNYIKACSSYFLQDIPSSLFWVEKNLSKVLNEVMQFRCLLLKGLLMNCMGKYAVADAIFRAANELEPDSTTVIYYKIFNCCCYLESKTKRNKSKPEPNGSTCVAKNSPCKQIAVQHLDTGHVEILVKMLTKYNKNLFFYTDFETRLLNSIHMPFEEPTLLQGQYIFARALAKDKKFSESAQMLLNLVKAGPQKHQHTGLLNFLPLPVPQVLLYESTAALLQANQYTEATAVCDELFEIGCEVLVTKMLLSKIQVYNNKREEALKTNSDCFKLIATKGVESIKELGPEFSNKEVIEKLMAKVYLERALIYLHNELVPGAVRYLEIGLSYNKKDKDCLYHLMTLTKNKEIWQRHHSSFDDIEALSSSLVIDFLLETKVKPEQINQLKSSYCDC